MESQSCGLQRLENLQNGRKPHNSHSEKCLLQCSLFVKLRHVPCTSVTAHRISVSIIGALQSHLSTTTVSFVRYYNYPIILRHSKCNAVSTRILRTLLDHGTSPVPQATRFHSQVRSANLAKCNVLVRDDAMCHRSLRQQIMLPDNDRIHRSSRSNSSQVVRSTQKPRAGPCQQKDR